MASDHTFFTVNAKTCQYSIDLLSAMSFIHKNTVLDDDQENLSLNALSHVIGVLAGTFTYQLLWYRDYNSNDLRWTYFIPFL